MSIVGITLVFPGARSPGPRLSRSPHDCAAPRRAGPRRGDAVGPCGPKSAHAPAIGYIALLLLAYELTGSAWAVSAVLLAEFVPAIVLGPIFGALADRHPRRTLVVTADLLRVAPFVALAFAGSLATVVALALLAGAAGALYQPAAKAALPGLAGEHADRAMGTLVASWSAAGMIGRASARPCWSSCRPRA